MKKIKWLFTGMICCLGFLASAQSVAGKWKFEIPSDQGTMVLVADIKADGTYTLDFGNDGNVEVNGTYTASGDQYTIKDSVGECTGKGVYTMTATATTLTMTRISDECPDRGGPTGKMVATRL